MNGLHTLRIRCAGSETSLDCDALAVAGHTVLLASVAGPASTIKALAALLQSSSSDKGANWRPLSLP